MEYWRTLRYPDRPIYPSGLQEQEEALINDMQMQDYRIQREKLKNAQYRPNYHYVRPDGFLNDPNGLCYWQGNWHMFYQACDEGCIHWGHAVSHDLLHWRDLPYAIYPNVATHCFSGATCVDTENNRVIAAYYGYTGYNLETGYRCGIVLATASDPLLLNWTEINEGLPVIPDGDAPSWRPYGSEPVPGQKPYQVFDPYIWKENGVYYILSAGYFYDQETNRMFRQCHLLRCEDPELKRWEFVKQFLDNDRFREVSDDASCPYFLTIGSEKRIMLHYSHRLVPKYILGSYDNITHDFRPFNSGRFTSGNKVLVAPCGCSCEDGSVVVIFNTQEQWRKKEWFGLISLPRKLTLGGYWNDELYQSPPDGVDTLHTDQTVLENIRLHEGIRYIPDQLHSDSCHLQLQISAADIPDTLEIEVLRANNGCERTVFTFFKQKGGAYPNFSSMTIDSVLMLDSTHASVSPAIPKLPPEIAQISMDRNEDLLIDIFIDKCIVEVFVNNRQCICQTVYPFHPDSNGFSILASGTDSVLKRLTLWNMDAIFK